MTRRVKAWQMLVALLLAIALLTTGCAMPPAVRQFTAAAKEAAAQFPPLAGDLAASCIRKQESDRPVDEIEDIGQQAKGACKEFSDLEPQISGALTVLVNYLNALNQLASNDSVSYDKQIDSIAGSVQTAGKLGDEPVKAVQGLAKFLADASASAWQRRKLGSALKGADNDVAVLTNALGTVFGEDYERVLRSEKASLRTRYREAILADPTKNQGLHVLIQDRWRADLVKLDNRRRAAQDYQKILEAIRTGHKELAEQVDRWNTGEVSKTLKSICSSLEQLTGDLKAALQ